MIYNQSVHQRSKKRVAKGRDSDLKSQATYGWLILAEKGRMNNGVGRHPLFGVVSIYIAYLGVMRHVFFSVFFQNIVMYVRDLCIELPVSWVQIVKIWRPVFLVDPEENTLREPSPPSSLPPKPPPPCGDFFVFFWGGGT